MGGNLAFGRWVKQRRIQLDITQKELADSLACSVSLLRKYEAGLRRTPLRTAERLADLLAIAPEQRDAFLQRARSADAPEATPVVEQPRADTYKAGGLPAPPNPLIGRQRELALLGNLLNGHTRLVTLVGPPGVGKTRLAQQFAALHGEALYARLCYVSLASLESAELVATAIARALGLREHIEAPLGELIKSALFEHTSLLVLDNFEHVLEAAPFVAELLAACPQLHLIVTSRAALRVRAERVLRVPPLALPGGADLAAVSGAEAVALFVDRAQALVPHFALTNANMSHVAEIVLRLDGLPLAIELAAAQAEQYTPAELLAQLERRLPLLGDGPRDLPLRQQTMYAALAWSYHLLDAHQQQHFRQLGVFSGGATPDAVRAVCATTGPAAEMLLAALTERSLLVGPQARRNDATRYTMLETLREYALEQLEQAGETDALRREHAVYFAALAERAGPQLRGPRSAYWLAALDAELDNLRTAMRWSHECDGGTVAARIIAALMPFWRTRGYFSEARRWAEPLLDSAAGRSLDPALRAKLLDTVGFLASQLGDLQAPAMIEESLALYRTLNDRAGVASALNLLGMLSRLPDCFERAAALHHESIAILRELGDHHALAASLNNLGMLRADQGEYASAQGHFREALALAYELNHQDGEVAWAPNLADALLRQGKLAQAKALYRDTLALARARGNQEGIAETLNGLGLIAYLEGNDADARAHFSEGLALYRTLGFKFAILQVQRSLGFLALRQNQPQQALAALHESLELARATRYTEFMLHNVVGLAIVAQQRDEHVAATRLLAAAEALRQHYGIRSDPLCQPLWKLGRAAARAALGTTRFADAWANGARLSLDQACAEALLQIG